MPTYPISRTSLRGLETSPPYYDAFFKEGKWYLDIPDIEVFLCELSKTKDTNELIFFYDKFTNTIEIEIYDDYRE